MALFQLDKSSYIIGIGHRLSERVCKQRNLKSTCGAEGACPCVESNAPDLGPPDWQQQLGCSTAKGGMQLLIERDRQSLKKLISHQVREEL